MSYKISKKTGKLYCLRQGECYCPAHKPELHINYFKLNPHQLPDGYRFNENQEKIVKINIKKCGWCKKSNPDYKMETDFIIEAIYSFEGFICSKCKSEILKIDRRIEGGYF